MASSLAAVTDLVADSRSREQALVCKVDCIMRLRGGAIGYNGDHKRSIETSRLGAANVVRDHVSGNDGAPEGGTLAARRRTRRSSRRAFLTLAAASAAAIAFRARLVLLERGGSTRRGGGGAERRPLRLIYHVGPPKSASTTLQIGGIRRYSSLLTSRDNFALFGRDDATGVNRCLKADSKRCRRMGAEWKKFSDFLAEAERDERNVLVSTENHWHGLDLEGYRDLLVSGKDRRGGGEESGNRGIPPFQVTIVVFYRRFFEYWPSDRFQRYRDHCAYSRSSAYQRDVPSLLEFLDGINSTLPRGLGHPAEATVAAFQSAGFNDVRVLNIHEGNLISRFFCDIANATETCEAARRDERHEVVEGYVDVAALGLEAETHSRREGAGSEDVPGRLNIGRTLYYDCIAQAALRERATATSTTNATTQDHSGEMRGRPKREARPQPCRPLRDRIKKWWEEDLNRTSRDLPLLCPFGSHWGSRVGREDTSQQKKLEAWGQWLFEHSQKYEELLLPQPKDRKSESQRKQEHDRSFESAVRGGALCDVDMGAVLSDLSWRRLLLG